jgi:hypothetical protein
MNKTLTYKQAKTLIEGIGFKVRISHTNKNEYEIERVAGGRRYGPWPARTLQEALRLAVEAREQLNGDRVATHLMNSKKVRR